MKMQTCPKFHHCSAPVCPLDSKWKKRKHLKDERVCFYLCEVQKQYSQAIFRGRGLEELYQLMVEVTPDISRRWEPIKKALKKATKTESRMNRNLFNCNSVREVPYAES